MVCPNCGSNNLKRGDQNLWCASCGFFPIPCPEVRGADMKIKVEVTISFAPKSRILKWVWAEKAQKALAVWLIRAGLRVSGSSEMIVTPKLWSTHEKQLADKS